MILLNTELPSLCLNYITVNCQQLLQSRFMRSQNIHNTRSKNTFIVRYSRTNLKAMCISVCGVKLWNALPINIKETRSLYTFKIKVKAYLLSYYCTMTTILTTNLAACVCLCVRKILPISPLTLLFRLQTSRKFCSHSKIPIRCLWTAFCVPLSFIFYEKR